MWKFGVQERSWTGVISDEGERSDTSVCLCLNKPSVTRAGLSRGTRENEKRMASWDKRALSHQEPWEGIEGEGVKGASFACCVPSLSWNTATFMIFPSQKTCHGLTLWKFGKETRWLPTLDYTIYSFLLLVSSLLTLSGV